MAQKVKVFDGQTVDGTSGFLRSFRGGIAVVSVTDGSNLGGGQIRIRYYMEANASGDTILAGVISDLANGGSINVEIPHDTAIFLELVGATAANVTAYISQLF